MTNFKNASLKRREISGCSYTPPQYGTLRRPRSSDILLVDILIVGYCRSDGCDASLKSSLTPQTMLDNKQGLRVNITIFEDRAPKCFRPLGTDDFQVPVIANVYVLGYKSTGKPTLGDSKIVYVKTLCMKMMLKLIPSSTHKKILIF